MINGWTLEQTIVTILTADGPLLNDVPDTSTIRVFLLFRSVKSSHVMYFFFGRHSYLSFHQRQLYCSREVTVSSLTSPCQVLSLGRGSKLQINSKSIDAYDTCYCTNRHRQKQQHFPCSFYCMFTQVLITCMNNDLFTNNPRVCDCWKECSTRI